jgi:two-component sensor histidine kinase
MIREGKFIWMATEGNGLARFDPEKKSFQFFEYFNYRKYLDAPRFIVSMIRDSKSRLWMGTYYGLYFKAAGKDSFYSYRDIFPDNDLKKTLVLALKEDKKGGIWLGTELGLFCLDENTLRIKRHFSSFGGTQSKPTVIESIAFDEQGRMWLGTKGEGLIRFNPETSESKNWTVDDGLSDNVVYSVIVKGDGIWTSTHNGLNYLNTKTGDFHHYYIEDGLPDNEFNHGAFLQSRSGDLYFGGINGVIRFNPEKLRGVNNAVYPLVLTQIDRYDPKTGTLQPEYSHLNNIKTITLPYDNRYLNVYFALTDYSRPDKNQYRYILEGYDSKWHNLGNQNYISMLGIPSGKYVLRIQATGSNGITNPTELRIHIVAKEIFYNSWWFAALALLLGLSIIAGFYFYRIRQYQKLIALRTQIASDLHDEVGSHLTRIAISSDLMKESPDNRIDPLIDHIAQSSRQAVATMSDVIWSIDTRSDKMGSLLDRMREHARNIFEPAGINYTIEAKNLGENDKLHMNQRHDLYLIFKEATNNIVKHSNATEVKTEISGKGGVLRMSVTDNGTNPPNPHRMTGMGLRNMQMRAKRMKGTLTSAFDNGYKVEFIGPAHT